MTNDKTISIVSWRDSVRLLHFILVLQKACSVLLDLLIRPFSLYHSIPAAWLPGPRSGYWGIIVRAAEGVAAWLPGLRSGYWGNIVRAAEGVAAWLPGPGSGYCGNIVRAAEGVAAWLPGPGSGYWGNIVRAVLPGLFGRVHCCPSLQSSALPYLPLILVPVRPSRSIPPCTLYSALHTPYTVAAHPTLSLQAYTISIHFLISSPEGHWMNYSCSVRVG